MGAEPSRPDADRVPGARAPTTTATTPASETATPAGGPASTRELDPDELAALEEQRAFLLTSLRDLEAEHDVGDVDEGDYEQLKDDYTARAAAVIRAIDSHHQLGRGARPGRRGVVGCW